MRVFIPKITLLVSALIGATFGAPAKLDFWQQATNGYDYQPPFRPFRLPTSTSIPVSLYVQPEPSGFYEQPSRPHSQPGSTYVQPALPPQPSSVYVKPSPPPQPSSTYVQPAIPPQPSSTYVQPALQPQPSSVYVKPSPPPQPYGTYVQPALPVPQPSSVYVQPASPRRPTPPRRPLATLANTYVQHRHPTLPSRSSTSSGSYSLPLSGYFSPEPSNQQSAYKSSMLMPFNFAYSVDDDYTGNRHSHYQNSDGRNVEGQYSVLLPDGRTQVVKFTSTPDEGYVAQVTYV